MSKPQTSKRLPWIFGRGGMDRTLICLAVNGPLTVRELGRATSIDSHKMWDMVERLRRRGLVVKRSVPGGRKYVSLNRKLPVYRALLRLLKALDSMWPATRYRPYTARWRMPFDRHLTTDRLDEMFQSPVRSRTLLFVASCGETDLKTIYAMLGLNATSVWLAVNHWERQAVLQSRHFKCHRLISLNPRFAFAKQLHALLRTVVATSAEHNVLRAAARGKQRAILKAAGSNTQIPKRAARSTGP